MLVATIAVVGPILGGFIVWWVQSRIEASRREAEHLRSERIKLYIDLFEPFMAVFSGPEIGGQQAAVARILTPEFRDLMYRVMVMGSDDVVRAINAMWGRFYANNPEGVSEKEALLSMQAIAEALLAIRRELGDSKTKLIWQDMLRARIKDLDEYLAKVGPLR